MKYRVLIASPVKQKPDILKEFLESLEHLDDSDLAMDFAFFDDHNDHDLLARFAQGKANVRIFPGDPKQANDSYLCDETNHHWQEENIWKVAHYKDIFIKLALADNYDYLFLVDSDLYLHPKTLTHLASLGKDIVSEVYWTKWEQALIPLPQVWVTGNYVLHCARRDETLTEQEANRRTADFLQMLSRPGTYKVGGLGACTLINRKALSLGVSFREIYNVNYVGEDRHFCIRAAALGLELYADTHYPPLHIYRPSDLARLREYKQSLPPIPLSPKYCLDQPPDTHLSNHPLEKSQVLPCPQGQGPAITLMMLVRNEAGRYLERVLRHAAQYIDRAVILDDASEDNTVEICRSALNGIPLVMHSNPNPLFHNEIILRKQLWAMATKTKPDWILALDADEIFEDAAINALRELATRPDVDYYAFRLYDMWTETHYREDSYWCAHNWYRPFMVRYLPGFNYLWQETPQHCGRLPYNITELKGATSELRVKHLGWMKPADRLSKYHRYKRLDPHARYGLIGQYESILDPRPNLLKWN